MTAVTSCSTVPLKPARLKSTRALMSSQALQRPFGLRMMWYCATWPLVSTTICRLLPNPAMATRIGMPQWRGVPIPDSMLLQGVHLPFAPSAPGVLDAPSPRRRSAVRPVGAALDGFRCC